MMRMKITGQRQHLWSTTDPI